MNFFADLGWSAYKSFFSYISVLYERNVYTAFVSRFYHILWMCIHLRGERVYGSLINQRI